MAMIHTRRRLLGGMALSVPAALLPLRRAAAVEPPPETSTIRLSKHPTICFAPQYVCEELLRAEGFTDIRWVDIPNPSIWQELGIGQIDFASNLSLNHIIAIDKGASITIVSGVHGGCYELFVHGAVRAITDLKGKRVGETEGGVLVALMAAWVGLDPKKDLTVVDDPTARPLDLFAEGKLDAYLSNPPEAQELHARKTGHVILRTAVDKPWSQYFCCMLAANREYTARYPVATKRVIRTVLKAADLCASNPELAARQIVEGGFAENYDYALQTLTENPYGAWREYDAEDTMRFYALRLHDLGAIKNTPQQIIANGTNWRFLNEVKRELKA